MSPYFPPRSMISGWSREPVSLFNHLQCLCSTYSIYNWAGGTMFTANYTKALYSCVIGRMILRSVVIYALSNWYREHQSFHTHPLVHKEFERIHTPRQKCTHTHCAPAPTHYCMSCMHVFFLSKVGKVLITLRGGSQWEASSQLK